MLRFYHFIFDTDKSSVVIDKIYFLFFIHIWIFQQSCFLYRHATYQILKLISSSKIFYLNTDFLLL